jgi:hypothetical protein
VNWIRCHAVFSFLVSVAFRYRDKHNVHNQFRQTKNVQFTKKNGGYIGYGTHNGQVRVNSKSSPPNLVRGVLSCRHLTGTIGRFCVN